MRCTNGCVVSPDDIEYVGEGEIVTCGPCVQKLTSWPPLRKTQPNLDPSQKRRAGRKAAQNVFSRLKVRPQ